MGHFFVPRGWQPWKIASTSEIAGVSEDETILNWSKNLLHSHRRETWDIGSFRERLALFLFRVFKNASNWAANYAKKPMVPMVGRKTLIIFVQMLPCCTIFSPNRCVLLFCTVSATVLCFAYNKQASQLKVQTVLSCPCVGPWYTEDHLFQTVQ